VELSNSRARRVNKTEDLFLRDCYFIPCKPYPKGLRFHIIMRCHITVGYRVPIGYHINMRSCVGVCCPCMYTRLRVEVIEMRLTEEIVRASHQFFQSLFLSKARWALGVPCFMWAFALKAVWGSSVRTFVGVVFVTTFSTLRVAFAVHCFMAIVEAVEALHDLILWGESFCCIVQPVYKETVHNAAICCTWIFHVDYD